MAVCVCYTLLVPFLGSLGQCSRVNCVFYYYFFNKHIQLKRKRVCAVGLECFLLIAEAPFKEASL